jgi:hypothetical protein
MHSLRPIGLAVMCLVSIVAPSGAQSAARVSVTVTGGPGTGWTNGEYRGGRSAVAVDVLLGARFGREAGGHVIAGMEGGIHGAAAQTADCVIGTSGECIPGFPEFTTLGILAGWESAGGRLRLMAGPTLALPSGSDATLGLQSRLDLAGRLIWRLAGVASVKSQIIPSYRGHAVGLLSAGLGIRVQ